MAILWQELNTTNQSLHFPTLTHSILHYHADFYQVRKQEKKLAGLERFASGDGLTKKRWLLVVVHDWSYWRWRCCVGEAHGVGWWYGDYKPKEEKKWWLM